MDAEQVKRAGIASAWGLPAGVGEQLRGGSDRQLHEDARELASRVHGESASGFPSMQAAMFAMHEDRRRRWERLAR